VVAVGPRRSVPARIRGTVEPSGAARRSRLRASPTSTPGGTGRRTVGGDHLVDGTHVAETDAGRDPDAPLSTSHRPTLRDESADRVVTRAGGFGDRTTIVNCLRDLARLDARETRRGDHDG
jgi:hypothetical protein